MSFLFKKIDRLLSDCWKYMGGWIIFIFVCNLIALWFGIAIWLLQGMTNWAIVPTTGTIMFIEGIFVTVTVIMKWFSRHY